MPVILTVEHIRKHFSEDPVLVDVTFQVRDNDKIGLVGTNGSGKTTLLNIIAGHEELERGSIECVGDASIGYLEQRPHIEPGRTVLEETQLALAPLIALQNEAEELATKLADTSFDASEQQRLAARYDRIHEALLRHDAYHLDHRVEKILLGLGFTEADFTKQTTSLSGGELNRLGLAKLLLEEPAIMLLDEPSNHLDLLATEWLEDFLRNTPAAVILVSHDRYFLDRVTNRTFELFAGTIDDYPGNFSKYSELKEERLLVQTRTYEKYVEEVEKAKEFIRRNHASSGNKTTQAEDRRKKLERLQEEPASLPRRIDTPPMTFPKASRTGDLVFRVENLSKGFGERRLFKELSFDVLRGQRWAIVGPNGCGKTTLLKTMLHEIKSDSGTVAHGQGVKVGYFDQMIHVINNDERVVDAVRPPGRIFDELARRNLLASFGLTGDQQLQTVGSLSGGQRCRAALARLSAEDANVLILDEPTNHLDLWARKALEEAIKKFDGSVIFISHDRYFVDRVADHLLIIQPDARFKVLEGNYTSFRQMVSKGLFADPFLANTSDKNKQPVPKPNPKPQPQQPAKKHKQEQKPVPKPEKKQEQKPERRTEQKPAKKQRKYPYRKVTEIEEEIFARETRIMSLNDDLLNPDILRDGQKVKQVQEEINEEQSKLTQLYEHWEEQTEKTRA
ncbi:MAG: ABC-F family ATP-binding cassette domain-containing protein [Planctomycetaceae bacterium]|nr:ABC-F family ATP-binding cassette domain-containing protein [Planctomycetaceae bacterium]